MREIQKEIAGWGVGINLGNALDAIGGECAWGNPKTTEAMIDMYAEAGFDILRIPVTWNLHIGEAPGYPVDPDWMDRVYEVVSWAMDRGLRVILNTHHEQCAWLKTTLADMPEVLPRFCALWQQIANRFEHFGERLVFQGINEPRVEHGEKEWEGGTADVQAAVNVLNAAFVKTVRMTGGRNRERWLCIPPVGAKPVRAGMNAMILPKDDHLIVTVHSYSPAEFIMEHVPENSTPYFTETAKEAIREDFEVIKEFAEQTGARIMITEHGAVTKVLPDGSRNDLERAKYEQFFLALAKEQGIPAVLWDNNYYDSGDEWFGLFDRSRLICNSPLVLDAILQGR